VIFTETVNIYCLIVVYTTTS